jgi:hypothetical protein
MEKPGNTLLRITDNRDPPTQVPVIASRGTELYTLTMAAVLGCGEDAYSGHHTLHFALSRTPRCVEKILLFPPNNTA